MAIETIHCPVSGCKFKVYYESLSEDGKRDGAIDVICHLGNNHTLHDI